MEEEVIITIPSILIALIFLAYLLWGIKTGQFKNMEEANDIPLKEEEGE